MATLRSRFWCSIKNEQDDDLNAEAKLAIEIVIIDEALSRRTRIRTIAPQIQRLFREPSHVGTGHAGLTDEFRFPYSGTWRIREAAILTTKIRCFSAHQSDVPIIYRLGAFVHPGSAFPIFEIALPFPELSLTTKAKSHRLPGAHPVDVSVCRWRRRYPGT